MSSSIASARGAEAREMDAESHASGSPSSPTASPVRGSDEKDAGTSSTDDTIWVDFEPDDKDDPFNFSRAHKYTITVLSVLFTTEVAATASAYVAGFPSMNRDLNVTDERLPLLGISLYALGFSAPPMVLAPFSELFGRRPVFLASFALYLAFLLGIALSPNIASVLVFRFLSGAAGSTGSTLSGGVISDIFRSEDRGLPMSLFTTAAIFGTGFGPAWAGWVEQNPHLQWRWIQWLGLMHNGAVFLAIAFFFEETRGGVILTKRAAKLRKETGNNRYRSHAEVERPPLPVLIKNSLMRPFWLLISEPIVFSFSLWISWLWMMMYSLLSSVGLIAAQHDYTPGEEGSIFWAICFAALLGQLMNPIQDRLYARYFPHKGPEARLYMSMVSAIFFPIGCFIYAWTSFPNVSMAGPIVGVIILMTSVYHVYLAVFNYLADSYLLFASSALAAQSFARNVAAFASPLFTTAMYDNLGYQWASSLVGFVGIGLGAVPFVLYAYGDRIRARSQFAKQLAKLEAARRLAEEEERARRKGEQPGEQVLSPDEKEAEQRIVS